MNQCNWRLTAVVALLLIGAFAVMFYFCNQTDTREEAFDKEKWTLPVSSPYRYRRATMAQAVVELLADAKNTEEVVDLLGPPDADYSGMVLVYYLGYSSHAFVFQRPMLLQVKSFGDGRKVECKVMPE